MSFFLNSLLNWLFWTATWLLAVYMFRQRVTNILMLTIQTISIPFYQSILTTKNLHLQITSELALYGGSWPTSRRPHPQVTYCFPVRNQTQNPMKKNYFVFRVKFWGWTFLAVANFRQFFKNIFCEASWTPTSGTFFRWGYEKNIWRKIFRKNRFFSDM